MKKSPGKTNPTGDGVVKPANSPLAADSQPASTGERVVISSAKVLVAHVTWFIAGPFILFLILINIVRLGSGWLTPRDAAFFVVVAAMLLGRWIDQGSGQGTTTTGEPSTWDDFRRYALLMPPVATGAWILANAMGNHWF